MASRWCPQRQNASTVNADATGSNAKSEITILQISLFFEVDHQDGEGSDWVGEIRKSKSAFGHLYFLKRRTALGAVLMLSLHIRELYVYDRLCGRPKEAIKKDGHPVWVSNSFFFCVRMKMWLTSSLIRVSISLFPRCSGTNFFIVV